jgi:hypothetical protein
MSDNPLDRIPRFDRVSIRAVLVNEGEDASQALSDAGIHDPVAIPVVFGEDRPDITFGDGITPNLTAVLETEQEEEVFDFPPPRAVSSRTSPAQQAGSATTALPPAYGVRSLAPVRPRGS